MIEIRGHIRQRGQKWTAFYDSPAAGKRNQRSKNFDTREEAEIFLIQRELERRSGSGLVDGVNPQGMTVAEYMRFWLDSRKQLAVTTREGYVRNIERHIIPVLGHIRMELLSPLDIQMFLTKKMKNGRLDGRRGGLSGKTVRQLYMILHGALDRAVKWKMIEENPADGIDLGDFGTNAGQAVGKKKEHIFLNREQVTELLDAVQNTDIYIPTLLGVSTGMRRGEVLGMKWSCLDLEGAVAKVRNALMPTAAGPQLLTPQKGKSVRDIPLPVFTVDELRRHKIQQEQYMRTFGVDYQDNDLVCCYPDGRMINPATFSHQFSDTLKRLKLPHMRFHDLRHTYASLLIAQGVPLKYVSGLLGHTNISTTANIYGHLYDEVNREIAEEFSSIFLQLVS
jgi:integrase